MDLSKFEYFSRLPEAAKWEILDNFSFLELISLNSDGSSQLEYLQHRLVIKDVDVTSFRPLAGLFGPINAYIKSLADSQSINKDITVLIHLSTSETVLFRGIEFFIGLTRTFTRAMKLRNADMLYYVLSLHPNINEKYQIFGEIFMEYMRLRDLNKRFTLLSETILLKILNEFSTAEYLDVGRFYPNNEEDYRIYQLGRSDQGSILNKDKNIYLMNNDGDNTVLSLSQSRAYLYGVIDGEQDEAFDDFNNEPPGEYLALSSNHYVAAHGTVDMMRSLVGRLSGHMTNQLMIDAVKADNIPMVKFFLTNYSDSLDFTDVIPTSLNMVDLLKSFGLVIPDERIFIGALGSDNYELLFSLNGLSSSIISSSVVSRVDQIPGELDLSFMLAVSTGPAFISSEYFKKHYSNHVWIDPNDDSFFASLFDNCFEPIDELYREEVFFELGYEPGPIMENDIRDEAEQTLSQSIIGGSIEFQLRYYPKLRDILMRDED